MATFSSGGLNIAYDDLQPPGDAAGTVLLVHGFATNRVENWKRLGWCAAFERKGYRVVAFDHRGHGQSDKPHDPAAYARREMLDDIVRLLDHLDIGRVDLFGYSMGARLSLQTAAERPDRVANLIVGGVGGRLFERPQAGGGMTLAQALRADDPAAIDDRLLKGFRLFADLQGEDRLALAALGEAPGGEDLAASDLARITAPTLVVAGALDELAGDVQALADRIPGARAVAIPGCDHFSVIPHALFKASVFDFLDGWLE